MVVVSSMRYIPLPGTLGMAPGMGMAPGRSPELNTPPRRISWRCLKFSTQPLEALNLSRPESVENENKSAEDDQSTDRFLFHLRG